MMDNNIIYTEIKKLREGSTTLYENSTYQLLEYDELTTQTQILALFLNILVITLFYLLYIHSMYM